MTQRALGVTDVASGAGVADYRTRERTVSGATVAEQYLLCQRERVTSFLGTATTFRIVGNGSQAQNLFALVNGVGSGVLVAIRRLALQRDVVSSPQRPNQAIAARMATLPTVGTVLANVPFDSAQSSNALVVARGSASADGATTPVVDGTPSAAEFWQGMPNEGITGSFIGQMRMPDIDLIPDLADRDPVILAEGEGLLAWAQFAVASPTTGGHHSIVNCCWEEFTLP